MIAFSVLKHLPGRCDLAVYHSSFFVSCLSSTFALLSLVYILAFQELPDEKLLLWYTCDWLP